MNTLLIVIPFSLTMLDVMEQNKTYWTVITMATLGTTIAVAVIIVLQKSPVNVSNPVIPKM